MPKLGVAVLLGASLLLAGGTYAKHRQPIVVDAGPALERPDLVAAADQFVVEANARGRMMIGQLLPRVSAQAAASAGVDPSFMLSLVKQLAERTSAMPGAEQIQFDLSGARLASVKQLTIAVLPTRSVVAVADQPRSVETGVSLAVLEQGRWHIQFVDCEARAKQIRSAYPELARVPLPAPNRKVTSQ